ncbi:MAG TPA: hypothetical protein VJH67_01335 [Candidatus Paceibacterota bacterium]
MPKNFFQDVVPPERRSIRDVPVMGGGARRRGRAVFLNKEKELEPAAVEMHTPEESGVNVSSPSSFFVPPAFPSKARKAKKGKIAITLAFFVIVGFIFGMMTIFTSANISITPKSESVSINLALKAYKASLLVSNSTNTPALHYEIISLKREGETEVSANGEEMVEKKAEGKITVYNNFSSESQRLIARTRFETKDGLVFRIPESIVVPGKTSSGPGSVVTSLVADESGEKYNVAETSFTVPGFKNDPARFKGFYADSIGEIQGGFIGRMKKVALTDKVTALEKLDASLKVDLQKEIESQIPEEFVLLDGIIVYVFKDLPQSDSTGDTAILRREVTAQVIILNKQSISSAIGSSYLSSWEGLDLEIRDYKNLKASYYSGFTPSLVSSTDTLPLNIEGQATVYAVIPGVTIAENLAGKDKDELNTVMAGFPAVYKASASVRPIWKGAFPKDLAKIHLNVD